MWNGGETRHCLGQGAKGFACSAKEPGSLQTASEETDIPTSTSENHSNSNLESMLRRKEPKETTK